MTQQPDSREKFERQLRERFGNYFHLLRLALQGGQRAYRAAAILLAVSPPLIAAVLVTGSGRWDLFERSGALTSMIGLLLASRRYLRRGIVEIAMMDRSDGSNSNIMELLEDIHATKLGLAISAFGTVIWGGGQYLQWWTFGYLVIWAAVAAFDAWRDFVRLKDMPISESIGKKKQNAASAG
jgi:hypothetical protein